MLLQCSKALTSKL